MPSVTDCLRDEGGICQDLNRSSLNVEEEDGMAEVRDGVVLKGVAFRTDEWNSKGGAERLRYRSMVVGRGASSLCGFQHYCFKKGLQVDWVRRWGLYISEHSSHDIFITSTAKDRWVWVMRRVRASLEKEGERIERRAKLIKIP